MELKFAEEDSARWASDCWALEAWEDLPFRFAGSFDSS